MKRRHNPNAKDRPSRDPFHACRAVVSHYEVTRAAARCWFEASPARRRMVSARAESFWEIVPVAMTGNLTSCEAGIERWLADEISLGSETDSVRAIHQMATDSRESGDFVTREFILPSAALHLVATLGIRLPTQQVAFIFYADELCRRLIADELAAEGAVAALAAIPTSFRTLYGETNDSMLADALAGMQTLAKGFTPGTYEPVTSQPQLKTLAHAEAQLVRAALAPRVIRNDDPADWPSALDWPLVRHQ